MNVTEASHLVSVNGDGDARSGQDLRVLQAVEEYLAALEAGQTPGREEFLSRHAAIAVQLGEYLDGLELIHRAGSAAGPGGDGEAALDDLAGAEPLGDFLLVRELGRGGMGVVYEAVQRSLNRRVALKVLPFAAALDSKQLQRFKNEAQAAALLHHTHIVPVFGVGCERGVHYYTMQYIEGRTLAAVLVELRQQAGLDPAPPPQPLSEVSNELLSGRLAPGKHSAKAGPPTTPYAPSTPATAPTGTTTRAGLSTEQSIKSAAYFRTIANLALQAAEALAHAHEEGVVHRDIKPANLLVDVKGKLWITDFGLARCQNQAGLTMTGDLVGTLRYMSPEQALAKRVLIDHRTDVYSLGVTLYELLTLEPAYRGHDREEVLQQIAFEEPRLLRRINKSIPTELETIVLKAMEKNPAERYATAQELADDLRRFLEDKPIWAKRPTLVQRARKWGRRHRAVVVASAVVLALALVLLGGTGGWLVQRRAAAEAEALRALAEAQDWQEQKRWPEARAAARRAEGLLIGSGGRAALRLRVSELLDDLAMVEQLEQIRLEQSQIVANKMDIAGADAKYVQAFRDYGVDVEARGLEAAAWIRTRSIAMELAVALDNWAMARRKAKGKDDPSWKQLLAIAQAADTDWPRTQVRQALATGSKTALEQLADTVAEKHLPATTLVLVSTALEDLGASAPAIALLREGQRRYPGDFWLNLRLGGLLADAKPPQTQEAVRFCTVAVALRPQSAGVYLSLGYVLSKGDRQDEAMAAWRKAIELQPNFATAYSNLGNALRNLGRQDEAVAACRKAIELQPDYADAYANLGDVLKSLGRNDEAVAAYRKVIELKPEYPGAHGCLGVALSNLGRLDEAAAAYRKAIELQPDLAWAYNSLGGVLCDYKYDYDGAIAAFHKAITLSPDYADARFNLGLAFMKKGAVDEAITAYRETIRVQPVSAKAYFFLGCLLCFKKHDYEGAIAAFHNAIQLEPNYADAHCNLGLALWRKGAVDEAIAACQDTIRVQPNHAKAYQNLGCLLCDCKHDYQGAIAAFRQAIKLEPKDADAHCNLGCALTCKGQPDEAMACFQEAIRLDKKHANAQRGLGGRLYHQGRWAEAEASYCEALRLAPNDARINRDIAWLRANCPDAQFRNIAKAVQLAQKATESDPKDGDNWLALGIARYRSGQWQVAVADLEKATDLDPRDNSVRRLFLAMAHWQLGDKEQARKFYKQAVEWLEKNQPRDPEELHRFRAKAAALLSDNQQQQRP